MRNGMADMYKKVVCLNNNTVFDNLADASKKFNCDELDIIYCCKNIDLYCKDKDGKRLVWKYYDDFNEMTNEEKENLLKRVEEDLSEYKKQVICLNTNKVYQDEKLASKETNISIGSIRLNCNKKNAYCLTKDGEKLSFMKMTEFKKLSQEKQDKLIKDTIKKNSTAIMCLNLNKKFKSLKEASLDTGVSESSIRFNCNKNSKISKNRENKRFIFMYLQEYKSLSVSSQKRLLEESIYLTSTPIMCLNLNKKFDDISDAVRELDISQHSIMNNCKHITKVSKDLDKNKFVFMLYKEFSSLTDKEKQECIKEAKLQCLGKNGEIICLNTNKRFKDIHQASMEMGVSPDSILRCCNKQVKYSLRKDGKRIVFMYYDEFDLLEDKERKEILKDLEKSALKKVINLKTNQIYDSVEDASNNSSLSVFTIRQQCNKKQYYSKESLANGPTWLYYEDYINEFKDKKDL